MPLINFLEQADRDGVDRVVFLLQHKREWQGQDPEIYKFLYKSTRLQNQDVQDCFQETYFGASSRTKVICVITDILGDIFSEPTNPDLRMYAKQLLINKSRPCIERYSLDYCRRLESIEKFTGCVGDTEIRALMEDIIANDTKYQMRIAALNKLDGLDKLTANYNAAIIKNILNRLFEKTILTKDDLYKIEWIMWAYPKESKMAWQELESLQIDRLLTLFEQYVHQSGLYAGLSGGNGYTPISVFSSSISYSAPLYSILKFIGYHTTDRSTYDKIISRIPPLVQPQEAGRGIGLLTKSHEFLEEITKNPAFNADFQIWDHANSGSAFTPQPDFTKELDYFHSVRKSSLLEMLSDETKDPNTRTTAMRMLCFSYGHDKEMLKNLLKIQDPRGHLDQEAQRLVEWISPSLLAHTSANQPCTTSTMMTM